VDVAAATGGFSHDANGNLTSDGTRAFEWDAESRLVAVTVGTRRSEFAYEGLSRLTRILEKENGVTVRDAKLLWDGTDIIEERLSTGEVKRFFSAGESHNGAARYLTRDHLGSIREVTDGSGAVVTRNEYDPYGRATRVAGTEDSCFGYTGHMHHTPSGLVLALYRAYDPMLGRWLSEDPAGMIDGPNLFAYVGNGVISRRDPLGLQNDSVSRSLLEAMRRGNSAEIRNILDAAGDVLPPALRQRALNRLKDLSTKARDLIRATLKRGDSYSGELEERLYEELLNDGSQKARKMCKLIEQSGRLMEKVKGKH
jgi:RHS repeat-associated protein